MPTETINPTSITYLYEQAARNKLAIKAASEEREAADDRLAELYEAQEKVDLALGEHIRGEIKKRMD